LLPNGLFTRIVTQARQRPKSFVPQVQQLFQTMAVGGFFGADEIKNFDGRLFDNAVVFELDADSLDILQKVSALDWSNIEPSIFGTLFVRSLDPSKRSQLGAQYTSKEDILLILEPVLMAPLRRKWAEVQKQAHDLAAQRKAATGAKKTKLDKQLRDLLIGFATELATMSVLDPACGSGNFLYLSLVLLLDLWKAVSNLMAELGFSRLMPTPDVAPSPVQMHGIEVNEYAHELAQTTIWIGYIQWFIQNGFGFPPEPILKPIDTVAQMDAILAFDEHGQAIEPEWPTVNVIVGNPPFLGIRKMRAELGDEYLQSLMQLYSSRLPPKSDLVCYWFEKARAMVETGHAQRCGLLATQSIRKGLSRTVLDRIKASGDIFFAYSDRPWLVEDAAVRVSIVGFDNGSETEHTLDDKPVTTINSDLSSLTDITVAKSLKENANICFPGTKKYGAFDIDQDMARELLSAKGNPHGRPNSDVVRPWVNGSDITGRRRGMWIIDFGVNTSLEEAAKYEKPFKFVEMYVKPERAKDRVEKTRDVWWLFERTRPEMREAVSHLQKFIVVPVVAKYRLFVFLEQPTMPDSKLYVFARDDNYFLGILQSRVHVVWSLHNGSRHGVGNDPVYNSGTCFETFPFPWPPGKEPKNDPRVKAIAAAARELVQLRDNWLNPAGVGETELKKRTLTNLYNERPTWLDNAHKKLDAAVFAAYGWPVDLSDDEILARLLALNLERAASEAGKLL
jgi:type II restriction/modification system DNA methylase subunit YeeA